MNKRRSPRTKPEASGPPIQPTASLARNRRLNAVLAAALTAGIFLYIFRHVLFQPRFFFWRDTGYFFYSLFKYIHRQWAEGRIPLWNPYSNGGVPLLAQGTTCVLYPGQLVFCLPLRYEVNLNVYILLHFVLALGGTYALSRRIRLDPLASGLVAITYVFSGSILFQYCNPPFLCSAAWMPLAFLAALEMIRRRSLGWALALAAVAALMLLAGDPQGAYHALILAAFAALVRWIVRLRRLGALAWPPPGEQAGTTLLKWGAERWRRGTLGLLFVAGATALLLTAVQSLPTAELSSLSTRAARPIPNSLWQVPGHLLWRRTPGLRADTGRPPNWYDALIGNPFPGTQNHVFRYMFSYSPIRLAEFVWPNFSGRMRNELRWLRMVRGEEYDLWFPTCYLGLAPLALAVAVFSPLCRRPLTAWLSWIALIATLGSLGCYGPVWLYRWAVLGRLQHSPEAVGGEVGGVYWLLSLLLPAYESFRYPSKLMSLAALALALLAGLGLRRLRRDPRWLPRARYFLIGAAVLSFLALINVSLFPEFTTSRLSRPDWLLKTGVLEPQAILNELRYTFAHTLVLAILFAVLMALRPAPAGAGGWRRLLAGSVSALVAVVTVLDLTAANRAMIITAPYNKRAATPAMIRAVAAAEASRPAAEHELRPFPRIFVASGVQGDEYELGTSNVSPVHRLGLMASYSDTLQLEQFEPFTNTLPLQGVGCVRPRCGLDAWGVDYFVWSRRGDPQSLDMSPLGLFQAWKEPRYTPATPQVTPVGPLLPLLPAAESESALRFVAVVANPSAQPRVWMVRQVEAVEPIDLSDRARWGKLMLSMNYPLEGWRDMRTTAVVEDAQLRARQGDGIVQLGDPASPIPDRLRFLRFNDDEIQLEAELASPGLLVLAESHYPGWRLHVSTDGRPPAEQPVLRVNVCMRGALLPAGKHLLTFRYVPASFWRGAAISGVAWLSVGLYGLVSIVRRRRRIANPT